MASNWDENADEATHVFENDAADGAATPSSERWYISADGRTKEVLEARAIIERARAGSLSDSTLVWRDGLSDWTRLDAVPELMQAVRAFRHSSPADMATAVAAIPVAATPAAAAPVAVTSAAAAPVAVTSAAATPDKNAAVPPAVTSPLAVASLPPLPPVPGASARAVPPAEVGIASPSPIPGAPLPQLGVPSLRPATVTLTGAPLPPPPSLPPKASIPPDRHETGSQSATRSWSAAEGLKGGGGTVKEVAAAAISSVPARLAEAKLRVSNFAQRDHTIPKIGIVKGWVILAVVGALLAAWLVASALWAGDEDEETAREGREYSAVDRNSAMPDNAASKADTPAPERGAAHQAGPKDNGEPEAETLSPADLEPIDSADPTIVGGVPKAGSSGRQFNVQAAKASLEAAADKARACKSAGDPRGNGSVRVKLEPSGSVSSVALMTAAFEGTKVGTCVQAAFHDARVPPFDGEAKTVFKKFTVR